MRWIFEKPHTNWDGLRRFHSSKACARRWIGIARTRNGYDDAAAESIALTTRICTASGKRPHEKSDAPGVICGGGACRLRFAGEAGGGSASSAAGQGRQASFAGCAPDLGEGGSRSSAGQDGAAWRDDRRVRRRRQ